MSCFLLPKSLYTEIERILNKFGCSTTSGEIKGISWLSWNATSMSKSMGTMGIRSVSGYNITLVGKLCWKFIKNPHSSVARVYKILTKFSYFKCYIERRAKFFLEWHLDS